MTRLASRLTLMPLICGTFVNTPLSAITGDDVEKAALTTPLASSTPNGLTETPKQRTKKRIKKRVTREAESTPNTESTQCPVRSTKESELQTPPLQTTKQILGSLKLRLFTQEISEKDEKQILEGLEAKSPKDRESFITFFEVDLLPLFAVYDFKFGVNSRTPEEGFYLKLLHAMAQSQKTNAELLSRAKAVRAILKHQQSEFFIPAMERPFTDEQMKALFDMTIKIQKPYNLRTIRREAPQPGLLKRLFSKLSSSRPAPQEETSPSPEESCRLSRQATELLFQNWGGAYCREADYVHLFDALETKTPDQIKSMGFALSDAVFAITSISPHLEINKILVELVTLPEDEIRGLVKLISETAPRFDKAPFEPASPRDRYNPQTVPTNFVLTKIRFWKEAHSHQEGIMGAAE